VINAPHASRRVGAVHVQGHLRYVRATRPQLDRWLIRLNSRVFSSMFLLLLPSLVSFVCSSLHEKKKHANQMK
jgi:hypothetical protein